MQKYNGMYSETVEYYIISQDSQQLTEIQTKYSYIKIQNVTAASSYSVPHTSSDYGKMYSTSVAYKRTTLHKLSYPSTLLSIMK